MGHFLGLTGSSTHLWLWNWCRQVGAGRFSPATSTGMNQKAGTRRMQDDILNFKAKFSQQISHQDLPQFLGHTGIGFWDATAL